MCGGHGSRLVKHCSSGIIVVITCICESVSDIIVEVEEVV